MTELHGVPVEKWMDVVWWVKGRQAMIYPGLAGHDKEICVNIEGYSHDPQIPSLVVEAFTACLPEAWKVESRGSRIEVHPSGHYNGGYCDDDIAAIVAALKELGLNPKVVTFNGTDHQS